MFNKKTKLKLTDFECKLLINGMNEFRMKIPVTPRILCAAVQNILSS